MYLACRHIKPGGKRCKSPALRGHAFCYYHARLHSTTKLGIMDDVTLPVPEDAVAIQESLGKVFEAILSSRIDSKQTAQLLWGLQIATNNLLRKPELDPKSVLSVTRNKQGLELAPVLTVCDPFTDCQNGCEHPGSCGRNVAFDVLIGRKPRAAEDPEADEPTETGQSVTGKDKLALVRWDGTNAEGEIVDREAFMHRFDDPNDDEDDDDDDDDDEEDGKTLLGTLLTLQDLKESLEQDD
jgi:hypothetical protein